MKLKTQLKTTDRYVKILNENGIKTIKDFFLYFPRTYEDRSQIKNISQVIMDGNIQCVKGIAIQKKLIPIKGKKLYEIIFNDENGIIFSVTFFNAYFQYKQIIENEWYIVIGKPVFQYGKIIFKHPNLVQTTETQIYNYGRLYPIYSEMHSIKPGRFAKKIWENKNIISNLFEEYLPDIFLKKFNLIDTVGMIKNLHFPANTKKLDDAKYRLYFDKMLRFQLLSIINKNLYTEGIKNIEKNKKIEWNIVKFFLSKLSFDLTNAQKKVIKEIIEDIHLENSMLRLLQGDVGSGKTIVAMTIMFYILKTQNGQSVFLAPLEVLANQHFLSISKLFLPLGVRTELLTGSLTKGQKDKVYRDLSSGKIDILIGTHAILQEKVSFKNLRLVVIDEQHKFGVNQRGFFKKFGSPHILQMTATPIPRSMALAFFGEFKVSLIDEMPVGRKKIHTKIISEQEWIKIKPRIITKIKQGQQVFIITPLIEESEKLENITSAMQEYEKIKELYSEIKNEIGLLHGKIKSKEKSQIMKFFNEGKYKILVSTTVIEVGIDIPQATIMIIKNSERFGLSQLHQLRGRIGRSELQSYCFLETKKKSGDSYKRLKAMEKYSDGFKLAQLDLEYRGAGEIMGLKQSGETDIPLSVLNNIEFLEVVQKGAKYLRDNFDKLKKIPKLKNFLENEGKNLLV